jgi:hypothetical protein
VPSDHPFISFGVNAEDVVLHRALADVTSGRYVEVGPEHPTEPSATRAFRERGWNGLTVDSGVPGRLDAVLGERLRPDDDIHFMVVDARGSEQGVLAGVDLRRWRPWVLVIRAIAPDTGQQTHGQWEDLVLAAGYEHCLFDGVFRFFVAAERAIRLRAALSYPANVLDDFVPHRWRSLEEEVTRLRDAHADVVEQLTHWRGEVLARWSAAAASPAGPSTGSAGRGSHEVVRLKEELAAMRATVSWRVTAPLRAVQQRRLREWR